MLNSTIQGYLLQTFAIQSKTHLLALAIWLNSEKVGPLTFVDLKKNELKIYILHLLITRAYMYQHDHEPADI